MKHFTVFLCQTIYSESSEELGEVCISKNVVSPELSARQVGLYYQIKGKGMMEAHVKEYSEPPDTGDFTELREADFGSLVEDLFRQHKKNKTTLAKLEAKLSDNNFLKNAPEVVVEKTKLDYDRVNSYSAHTEVTCLLCIEAILEEVSTAHQKITQTLNKYE